MTPPHPTDPGLALLQRIAEATALREGAEGVAAVLRTVAGAGTLPLRELARAVRLPLPVASAVRGELEAAGLTERSGGGLRLSAGGRRFCAEVLGLAVAAAEPLAAALRTAPPPADGDALPEALQAAVAAMEAHLAAGPPVDVTLDQAPCTAETAVRRALAMHRAGAVEGRRIALLGDDDSMSVAIPLVARQLAFAPPARLAVFELDPARCRQLHEAAARLGIPAEIVAHDLRDPLPAAHRGAFDAAVTDPPYTLDGAALFLRRGLEALRDDVNLPFFLSYADLAPPDQHALFGRLMDLGLAAMRIQPSFNRYAGAAILGSAGQFLELRTAGGRAPEAMARFEGAIYTGEARPRLRRFRCQSCRTEIVVGAGEPMATAEALKAAGCPHCGAKTFRREGLVRR